MGFEELFNEAKKDCVTIHTDGATVGHNGKLGTVTEVGLGIWIKDTNEGFSIRENGISNNEAEFIALIRAMEIAIERGYKKVLFLLDSQIVKNRVLGKRPKKIYENKRMDAFQDKIFELKKNFDKFNCFWIPREDNYKADELSKIAAQIAELQFSK